MKIIPLTRGKVAVVSDLDYPRLRAHKWTAHWDARSGKFYAVREVRMHCEVVGCLGVDHRNRDTLDNRRRNLRPASKSQNNWNSRKPRSNTSGYKGVYWNIQQGTWRAYIQVHGHKKHLGCFSNLITAARAYDAAAQKYFGEFACVNFPKSKTKNQKI